MSPDVLHVLEDLRRHQLSPCVSPFHFLGWFQCLASREAASSTVLRAASDELRQQ